MQVLVVGGGMQGLCIAAALAREGHDVQLAERETPGQRASWVAAGLLTPSSPWKYPQALVELCFASEALFPGFVADLVEHTGIDTEYEVAGMLYPEGAGVRPEALAQETARRRALGFDNRHLSRAELDALQPGLAPAVSGAVWQPRSARVRPPRLMAALRRRVADLGVLVTNECEVTALLGSPASGVRGALTASGQELPADCVVLAAGAWSKPLAATLGLAVDVRPVRGQILLLRGEPGLLGPTINNGEGYLVPRRDGRVLVGSTMEDVGFADFSTPAAIARLRAAANALFPACAQMEVETDWAGLRPGTPDRLPYIGPVPELPGLVLATGHFRNGILLGPVTAAIVADLLGGRKPCADIRPYAPRPVDPEAVLVPAS
ncbi:MAG TPA: glycine oxidase ThiO [Planctomycetota bacterium]|nr:glycine oxidase ThiO [Planctomycetota bacterium]